MSGVLKKSPSEGDISSSVTDITAEESYISKKEFSSQKSYHPPDFKRGFLASTGFRLVWKTPNDEDITSLNRVLDLPQESKRPRSTSPKLVRSDYVFSEYFDPLAVLKRADSVEDETFESMRGLPDDENATTERKKHSDLEKIELPSVKNLKSLFENPKKQAATAGKNSIKRSHTISGHETSYLKSKSTEPRNDTPVERRHSSSSQPKISQTKAESANELSVDAVARESSNVTEEIDVRKADTEVKEPITISKSSSAADIESGHIQRVQDLLLIFQNLGKIKSNSRSVQIKSSNSSEIKHRVQENSEALDNNHGEVTKTVFEKPVRVTKTATEKPLKVTKATTEEPFVTKVPTAEEQVKVTKAAIEEPVTISRSSNQESGTHEEIVNKCERITRTEDHLEIPSSTSVFNLRQKFEVLMLSNNSLTEKDKKKTDNAQSSSTHKITKTVNDSNTKTNKRYSKDKLELKLDLNIQTDQEVQTDVSRIERNAKFRRSVKDITLQYEAKTLKESKSAPVTPFTTPTTASTNKPFSNIVSSTSSPYSSGNKIYINQTIENSNKFSSEIYVTPKEENRKSKQNVGENTVLEEQNIRPLGSFEKQSSVTKIKDRYAAKFEKHLSSQSLKKEVKEVKTTELSSISKDLETETEKDHKEISHGNLRRQVSEKTTVTKEIPTLMKSINIPSSESQKEMSLGSLQRQASVTKMKEKYEIELGIQKSTQNKNHAPSQDSNETFDKQKVAVPKGLERQSSVPKLKDKYESQIQRHNSSPSLKSNINESLNLSNSTSSPANFETKAKKDKKDATDIDKNKKGVDGLSGLTHNKVNVFENKVSESKAQDEKVKRKSQIEELVDSFIKSEGVSKYLEVSTEENSLTSEHKSRDANVTTTEAFKYSSLQDHKLKESSPEVYENSLTKNLKVSHEEAVKSSAKTFEVSSKEAARSSTKTFEESPKEAETLSHTTFNVSPRKAEKSAATFEASFKEVSKSSAKSLEVSAKEADKSVAKTIEISPKEAEKSIIKTLPPSGVKSEINQSSSSSTGKKSQETIIRAGSRELKPDELKYFQTLSAQDAVSENVQRRERSSSFDSGSSSTKTSKEDFTRSKLRSSSRQYRELHQDELKFFDSKIDGTMSKMSFRTTSELALRQEVLEKTMRLSTFENVERIE